ncbi:MAG: DUF2064 domain-containing protein [Candidatus Thorarchaeota archaeon]
MKISDRIAIIVFTKVPIPGLVKTRLYHPQLDENYIRDLQAAMLVDTLVMLEKISMDFFPILAYFPEEDLKKLEELIMQPLKESIPEFIEKYRIIPQKGRNISERFSNVFSFAFNELHVKSAIIIGSDTPHLQPNLMIQSCEFLQKNSRAAVLGPSQNGGFYLLGHNSPFLRNIGTIFQKKSSFKELGNAMELFKSNGHTVHVLPEVTDVDTFENLKTVRIIIKMLSLTSSESLNSYYPEFTNQVINTLDELFWVNS